MAKHTIESRGIPLRDACAIIGISTTFFQKRRKLFEEQANFPKKDPLTGRYDRKAIERWMDTRSGISDNLSDIEDAEAEIIEMIRNGSN